MTRLAKALLAPLSLAAITLLALIAPAAHSAAIEGKMIMLPSKERQVHVTYFRAPGETPRPSALLLHGAGGFDRRIADNNHYAAMLADAGIDAYLVYYYSDLDDKMMSFGVNVFGERYPHWAQLVDDLADYLVKQKDSNGKVGLVGFSNGGILATGASTLDPTINAAVIYYGTDPWPLGQPATRFPPLLVLHGDADQVIPVENGKQLAEEAMALGARVDLVIYPGQSHGFGADWKKADATDAFNRTVTFLKKELNAK
jgi:carboxymethylenebutenolidase